ncbi:hypothetical protein UG55_102134 [Frankia sp. EI5c]|uniref:hypothetical protein n=1 Tax=Frankia sp. EI5c TaxID=683316 RepID=UPI0007C2179A|nr:hypothetical protein [Frankia sp. EI5c]OAA25600.1 hypothetical protein UG55_102134 [Frankia sp. EI5c]
MAGSLGGVCGPGSSDLLVTLAGGLDERERVETMRIITRRLIAERAAAAGGQRERQVDVGTRNRASRARRPAGQTPAGQTPARQSSAGRASGGPESTRDAPRAGARRG